MQWGAVEYVGVADPPTTTLHVDVLSEEGVVLLEDVASGASLAGLDAATHPSLRLRVRLESTVAGASPELAGWGVVWEEGVRVFLPVVQFR